MSKSRSSPFAAPAHGAATLAGLFAAISRQFTRVPDQSLRERNDCLEIAINKMTQGLTMWDSTGRLVLCNQRYIEMYGLSPDVVRPGCTAAQLLQHRIETGSLTLEQARRYVNRRDTAI